MAKPLGNNPVHGTCTARRKCPSYIACHTTPKDSLISAVPISVQLLHSLSLALSYPSLAPQARRVGKSPITTPSSLATITIPKANRRTEQDEEKNHQHEQELRLRLFSRFSVGGGWAELGKPLLLPPFKPLALLGSANSKPEPTSVPRLAACLLHRCDILAQ
ncbi:hypothetical protein J3F84DRAFT_382423 [Trichoderma pleuroticola]